MSITSSSTLLHGINNNTYQLMRRMLNPICGMVQEIGFIKRNKFGPRILTAGADITGAHVLLGLKIPVVELITLVEVVFI